jgi:HEPN domain-containing protein
VSNDLEPPKTHDLEQLLIMARNISEGFSVLIPKCAFLTKYGVIPRYPMEIQIVESAPPFLYSS